MLADQSSPKSDTNTVDYSSLWKQFESEFPTVEHCIEELYRMAGEQLLKCKTCSKPVTDRKLGSRTIWCPYCRRMTWTCAGTFFERMQRPRAWLAIIWFFQRGIPINGWKLHQLSEIAPSSAAYLLKKFATVIRELIPQDSEQVSSALFSPLFAKRSRKTPAGKHPISEEDEFANCRLEDQAALSNFDGRFNLDTQGGLETGGELEPEFDDEHARYVYSLLSHEPARFETLCSQTAFSAGQLSTSLTILELSGLAVRSSGDRYARANRKCLQRNTARTRGDVKSDETAGANINQIIDFIKSTWKGISRKYLQNYLGIFRFLNDKQQRSPESNSLVSACIKYGPIHHEHIIDYVTPPMVQLGIIDKTG